MNGDALGCQPAIDPLRKLARGEVRLAAVVLPCLGQCEAAHDVTDADLAGPASARIRSVREHQPSSSFFCATPRLIAAISGRRDSKSRTSRQPKLSSLPKAA